MRVDFELSGHGTLYLLRPVSRAAHHWVKEHRRSRLHHAQSHLSNDPHGCLHCIKYGALCQFLAQRVSQRLNGAGEVGTLVIVDKRLVPLTVAR